MPDSHFDYYGIRTRLESGLVDAWDFASTYLPMNGFAQQRYYVYEWYRVMYGYVQQLARRDLIWRQQKQIELANQIRSKLVTLQEQTSTSCPEQKYVSCPVKTNCGFGCTVHHLGYCLIVALALNRTLIFAPQSPYSKLTVVPLWNTLKPLEGSTLCLTRKGTQITEFNWPTFGMPKLEDIEKYDVVKIDLIKYMAPPLDDKAKDFKPLAVPKQLRHQLEHLSQMPFSLFVGHVLDYAMRPNEVRITR